MGFLNKLWKKQDYKYKLSIDEDTALYTLAIWVEIPQGLIEDAFTEAIRKYSKGTTMNPTNSLEVVEAFDVDTNYYGRVKMGSFLEGVTQAELKRGFKVSLQNNEVIRINFARKPNVEGKEWVCLLECRGLGSVTEK